MASSNLLPNCIDLAPLVRRLMLPRVQGAEVGRTRGTAATVANAQAQAERLRPVLAELNHLSANATGRACPSRLCHVVRRQVDGLFGHQTAQPVGERAMKFAFCVIIIIIAAVLAPTLMLTEPVLAGAQSKPATAIKKKKGEACPANTNDCNPQSWCCVKPSICVRGGCTQPR
jgi:hypothetical protein